mgnify:CR=1 FL=1
MAAEKTGGIEPKRMVVIFYVLAAVVIGFFLEKVLGLVFGYARWADPGILGEDWTLTTLLAEASADLFGRRLAYRDDELSEILSPRYFVQMRKTLGGPAPEETARAAEISRAELETDQSWWSDRDHLDEQRHPGEQRDDVAPSRIRVAMT